MSLKEDFKQVPSWVWLGGAAGVGLLWVLSRTSGSSGAASAAPVSVGTTPTTTAAPVSTSGMADYGALYDSVATLQTEVQTLMQQTANPVQTNTPMGTPAVPTLAPGAFAQIPNQRGGYTLVPLPTGTQLRGVS